MLDFYLDYVTEMHEKFKVDNVDETPELAIFRSVAMHEEVNEFMVATLNKDRAGQLDALVDLAVFLFGTVQQYGFSQDLFREAFTKVMEANLEKEVAGTPEQSKRGWGYDLIKPEGWEPADIDALLNKHEPGWWEPEAETEVEPLNWKRFHSYVHTSVKNALRDKDESEIPMKMVLKLIGRPEGYWSSGIDRELERYNGRVRAVRSNSPEGKRRGFTRTTILIDGR